MNESNLMLTWAALIGSVAMIALVLTAFGLMLRIVKPADAPRRVVAILGIVMLFTVLPAVILGIWSDMPALQRLGVTVVGVCVLLILRSRRQPK